MRFATLVLWMVCLLGAGPLAAQTSSFPGAVPTDFDLVPAVDNAVTVLSGNINATTLVLPVRSPARFVAGMLVSVGLEIMQVCSTTSLAVVICPEGRGYAFSTAAPHAFNSRVEGRDTAFHHNLHSVMLLSIMNALGPNLAHVKPAVSSTDPGCAAIGDQWFDTTTSTTAFKVCLSVAGTLTWVAK